MRLVIVHGPSTANDFLVGSLAVHRPELVVREHQPAVQVLSRAWRRRRDPLASRLDKLAFFAFYGLFVQRGLDRDLRERLGDHPPVPPGPTVHHITQALGLVEAVRPELILSIGASILSDDWQQLGAPILNLHVGIAPRYRGRFCWFWPVLEGHSEDIGVTLHLVTSRVDAGPIVLQRRAPRSALGDLSFADLLAAVTRLAREVCDDFLSDPQAHLAAAPRQSDPGASRRPAYLEPGLTTYLQYVRSISARPGRS
jgi:hypothetical protein